MLQLSGSIYPRASIFHKSLPVFLVGHQILQKVNYEFLWEDEFRILGLDFFMLDLVYVRIDNF